MKLDKTKVYLAMAEKKMNRSQIAKETGISPSTLRYAVAGISNTRPDTAEKIAAALEVKLEDILESV